MDAAGWDARYAWNDRVWSPEPNPLVVETLGDLPVGTALDLGTGEGRHALWLAERGWTVTAVDFSAEAIRKARALQAEHAPETIGRVTWVQADVIAEPPRPETYDAVVAMYLHLPGDQRRRVLRAAAEALVAEGTLLIVGHDTTNLTEGVGGPQDPDVLFTAEDVVADLGGLNLQVRRAERISRTVDDGRATALDAVVEVVRG